MALNVKKFFALVLLTGSALGAMAQGKAKPTDELSLFPSATCNVNKAMPLLRDRLQGRDLDTEWDGDFPWPDVLGVWTNSARDTYLVVGARELPGARWGHIHVTLRSICNDEVIAQGARIIRETDWSRDYLLVRLRNYNLNGNRLTAIVRVPQPQSCQVSGRSQKLEVRIIQDTEDGSDVLRDSFLADRF